MFEKGDRVRVRHNLTLFSKKSPASIGGGMNCVQKDLTEVQ